MSQEVATEDVLKNNGTISLTVSLKVWMVVVLESYAEHQVQRSVLPLFPPSAHVATFTTWTLPVVIPIITLVLPNSGRPVHSVV